jgi:hypothetical protein
MERYTADGFYLESTGETLYRPKREHFVDGIDGTIEFLRMSSQYQDLLSSSANCAFDKEFRRALKRGL